MEIILLILIIEIPTCIGMGLIFKKMHLDFFKGLIPIYNKIILINKFKLPQYNIILVFIPIISIYSSFIIYKKICEIYKKDTLYVIELTIFPFIFNIFLGLEIAENYEEEIVENKEKTTEDEYVWGMPKEKSQTIYKVSRENQVRNVNIKFNKTSEIIEDNKSEKQLKKNKKECPNCSSKIPLNAEICPVCGEKII